MILEVVVYGATVGLSLCPICNIGLLLLDYKRLIYVALLRALLTILFFPLSAMLYSKIIAYIFMLFVGTYSFMLAIEGKQNSCQNLGKLSAVACVIEGVPVALSAKEFSSAIIFSVVFSVTSILPFIFFNFMIRKFSRCYAREYRSLKIIVSAILIIISIMNIYTWIHILNITLLSIK